MSWFVKVPEKEAEEVRNELLERGVVDYEYDFVQKEGYVFIPVKEKVEGFENVNLKVEKRDLRPRTLEDALEDELSGELLDLVPTKFDIIGRVAVLDIPEEIEDKSEVIARGLLEVHPNIKTVCKKAGSTKGVFRVKPVEVVLGEDTVTEHRESGVRMRLDVSSVYFTPRLSSERLRVARLVSPGERVLVMFAGVGPYALVIGKEVPEASLVCVEINPVAVNFLRENVLLNDMSDRIRVLEGDVRDVVPELGFFDRIIMPLPRTAWEYLGVAKEALKQGGVVHFYSFADRDEPFKEPVERIKRVFPEAVIGEKRVVGNISPGKVRVVIDFHN